MPDRDEDRARRFRTLALPYLDDAYTLARYLMRDATEAEDAVQDCYLRALTHFDTFRGPDMRPWLFAILRNVCRSRHAQKARMRPSADPTCEAGEAEQAPFWSDAGAATPEAQMLAQRDADAVRRLILTLPETFREVLVLRDVHDLSYKAIADVIGAPIGTVMSRLSRARAMLRAAWLTDGGGEGAP